MNWGLNDGTASLRLCSASKFLSANNSPVKIAIVDTVVDGLHSGFQSKLITVPKINQIDPQTRYQTFYAHGTHIAGIIDMVVGSTIGRKNQVELIAIRGYASKDNADVNLAETLKGFKEAISRGVKIINYSGGGTSPSDDELKLIKEAESKGILVVVAAGNDGSELGKKKYNYYPAGYGLSNMIVVTSVDQDGKLLTTSNFGLEVDVAAPGSMIESSIPGEEYMKMSGTSQATAFVTGLATVLLSQDPSLSPQDLKKLIIETATKSKHLRGRIRSNGTANAKKALARLRSSALRKEDGKIRRVSLRGNKP